jgi:hypothetical protein
MLGLGLLGTVLVVVLIVWVIRRLRATPTPRCAGPLEITLRKWEAPDVA